MRIFKDFTFDSAHFLPNMPKGHKCGKMHGHTYKLRVWLEGDPDVHTGCIVDYAIIGRLVEGAIICRLDHEVLNNVRIENPTTENLAVWVIRVLAQILPSLHSVEINESSTTGCIATKKEVLG